MKPATRTSRPRPYQTNKAKAKRMLHTSRNFKVGDARHAMPITPNRANAKSRPVCLRSVLRLQRRSKKTPPINAPIHRNRLSPKRPERSRASPNSPINNATSRTRNAVDCRDIKSSRAERRSQDSPTSCFRCRSLAEHVYLHTSARRNRSARSFTACGPNQRFHVIEVFFERASPAFR